MIEEFLNGRLILHHGDCLEVMATLPENSIDSCVTDPPYHLTSIVKRFKDTSENDNTITSKRVRERSDGYARLVAGGFMGKQWDGGDIAFRTETWAAVYRVLKPGAHLIAFGGTRTYHRMACAIEDAGFEIRDQIQWLYGSGFPKSHDVAKSLDGTLGRQAKGFKYKGGELPTNGGSEFRSDHPNYKPYEPTTDAARQWQGWGTALKPANEPIVLARKPLSEKTIAANVLRWGTGAINVDGCRVELNGDYKCGANGRPSQTGLGDNYDPANANQHSNIGKWPANAIHDGSEEVLAAFPSPHGAGSPREAIREANGAGSFGLAGGDGHRFGDEGSAARFFYSAKADADDRLGSKHPTIKPVDLLQYLVRLITPKGGTCLDPFAGTGTTGEAAWREGMRAVLIEREPEYQADIRRRMALCLSGPDERARESIKAKMKDKPTDHGPLFGGVT